MENKQFTILGKGTVQNGVMTFRDANGVELFSKNLRPVIETPVVEAPVVEPEVKPAAREVIVEPLDVPSFMKKVNRFTPIVAEEPKSDNLIIFPTDYKGEQKRTFRKDIKKLWNWLWTETVIEGGEK
jgi:hypothetical protein